MIFSDSERLSESQQANTMASPTTFEEEFLTTKQIAKALKKSLSTIQRWCRDGKIPAAKIEGTYIVRRQDFEEWFGSKLSTAHHSIDHN